MKLPYNEIGKSAFWITIGMLVIMLMELYQGEILLLPSADRLLLLCLLSAVVIMGATWTCHVIGKIERTIEVIIKAWSEKEA
ncbi:MAG: hypothetical protein WC998_08800 [Candidatus Paceibacterota bacterium]